MKTGRGKEKQRDIEKRKRKSTFLFAAEGNNVTEKNYFKAINSDRVHVIFTKGNETDPVKLMNRLIEESKNLDPELGDRAFCLVDADVNPVTRIMQREKRLQYRLFQIPALKYGFWIISDIRLRNSVQAQMPLPH